jgi:hypothetical protein
MKIKSYYYIIVGVFCLFLENQTLFGIKVQIPEEVMRILNDQDYSNWRDRITTQHQGKIRDGYKASICKTYGFNPKDLNEDELGTWMEEDLREGKTIGPEYYALAYVQQFHKKTNWQQSIEIFLSQDTKAYQSVDILPEDLQNPAGETNIYWALYQAGLLALYGIDCVQFQDAQARHQFAVFCFTHLLILSNDKDPTFLPSFESNPRSNTIRCLRVAFKMLSNHYLNRYMIKQAQFFSNIHFIQY